MSVWNLNFALPCNTHTHTRTHTHTGQYPQINDDLVNSHHLLLCCMDMLFCAAVTGKRRDLLNPECSFLPEDFSSSSFTCSEDKMCVFSELCDKYGGILHYTFAIIMYIHSRTNTVCSLCVVCELSDNKYLVLSSIYLC